ncbi:hypothetical protein BCR39DRAFT_165923 [Naematelia encephala]|uniref:Oxidoreductase n=1 Tax=Naematelia encephala TaxID=71784 RepID=A0A1Y2B4A9_9TREE|nr:hypothetical protein BCR39DRAFT_165923 [Naematelia encephala]
MADSKIEKRKVALVTGCSEPTSLGAGFCRDLLRRGWRVFASARKVETMDELRAEGCDVVALDVQSEESIEQVVQIITASAGRLDLLINNAGVAGSAPGLNTDPKRMLIMYDINVLGPLRTMQACAPLLINTANAGGKKGWSHIINIGSVAAWGPPWQISYDSSKAALHSMSDVMKREMHGLGIKITAIHLALVKTAMTNALKPFSLTFPDSSNPGQQTTTSTKIDYFATTFPKIRQQNTKDALDRVKTAPTPDKVARYILDNYESKDAIWAGKLGWLFKFVFPYLPNSVMESIWIKLGYCNWVERPHVV